ncbi:hypothetical protein AGLY_010656 [Aphis glycines]|uniref:Uncharacterized protein n=1 Tax=Aphis glycines TaxID=307491 RepID=A0A6G0TFH7_APHGL|nr:hypothetical protein AGLY_010656 [Aphis glycines]
MLLCEISDKHYLSSSTAGGSCCSRNTSRLANFGLNFSLSLLILVNVCARSPIPSHSLLFATNLQHNWNSLSLNWRWLSVTRFRWRDIITDCFDFNLFRTGFFILCDRKKIKVKNVHIVIRNVSINTSGLIAIFSGFLNFAPTDSFLNISNDCLSPPPKIKPQKTISDSIIVYFGHELRLSKIILVHDFDHRLTNYHD